MHIGKILDAHGIKGDLYCFVFSGDTSWITQVKFLTLRKQLKIQLKDKIQEQAKDQLSKEENFEIIKIKAFKKGFIATLKGIQDRNMAETYKGSEVWVKADLFISKDGESLYLSELIEFKVNDHILGEIGQVRAFSSNSLQDLLVIANNNNNKTFEVPFVKEFVSRIDYVNKAIYMKLPLGLLEINEPN